jgi:hypothetical protein
MPTASVRPSCQVSPVQRADVPALLKLSPSTLRVKTPAELERHLFDNPYLSSRDLFTLRGRAREILGVAVLVTDSTYADPKVIDPLMPCFRLGAFGTEGMQTKRIKGVFSFLAPDNKQLPGLGLDALSQATMRAQQTDDIVTLAAQVPSDVPHLLQFYQRLFRKQGAFPVYERKL